MWPSWRAAFGKLCSLWRFPSKWRAEAAEAARVQEMERTEMGGALKILGSHFEKSFCFFMRSNSSTGIQEENMTSWTSMRMWWIKHDQKHSDTSRIHPQNWIRPGQSPQRRMSWRLYVPLAPEGGRNGWAKRGETLWDPGILEFATPPGWAC